MKDRSANTAVEGNPVCICLTLGGNQGDDSAQTPFRHENRFALWRLMKALTANWFTGMFRDLRQIAKVAETSFEPDHKHRTDFAEAIEDQLGTCQYLYLPMSAMQAERLKGMNLNLEKWSVILAAVKNAEMVAEDELSLRTVLAISPEKIRFYEGKNLFGPEVTKGFPSASLDIEEAGKCLATNRNTACVFHLMRVLEKGLLAMADSLKDPSLDPRNDPTWGVILRGCTDELNKSKRKRRPEWLADNEFFSDATANLRAVKDAWRNPTIHVAKFYDAEKAKEVFNTVRSFMRHLATRLKE